MNEPVPHTEAATGHAGSVAVPLAGALRLLQRSALVLLVLCAAWVGCGRLMMPLLVAQKDEVEARIGQLLGTRVDIAVLEGSWSGLSPGFALQGVGLQLDPADSGTRFAIDSGELSLDLLASLWQGRPALNRIVLSGLELSLQQSANGRWSLRGLPPGERDYKDLILDLLLTTPDIRVQEARVRVALADGRELPLRSVYLQLENSGRRHELRLQFRLGDTGQPQVAVLQLRGDPRGSYLGSGWLSLDALDLQASVAPLLPAEWRLDELQVDGDVWFDLDRGGLRGLQARVEDLRLRGALGPLGEATIVNTTLELGAWPEPGTRGTDPVWRLGVRDPVLEFNGVLVAPGRLNLRLPFAAAQPWTLQAERLDVATLTAVLGSLPLPDSAASALATLAPQGQLGPLYLESDRSGDYPDGFLLRTRFERLAVEAWRGAPAASGLEGYAELVAGRGFAEVDSREVSLHLPNLFRNAWQYERVNTRINWEFGPGELKVASTPISVSSPQLSGRVRFALHNTGMGTPESRSDLALAVGMDWMDVAIHADYLPTLPTAAATMAWLDDALLGGRIVDSAFLLRSSRGLRHELDSLTHSSWYRVEDATLRFLPEWPVVEVARAGIFVSDQHTDVVSDEARIAGITANRVTASVRPQATGGSLLRLQVQATSDLSSGLDFLRDTPVREQVGATLDDWEGSGSLDLQLALQQPLGAAAQSQSQTLELEARPQQAGLTITPYQLQFSGLSGLIRYSHSGGLQAQELQGNLFGSPLTVDVDTRDPGAGDTRSFVVRARGTADPAALAAWEGQSGFVRRLLGFTSGEIGYRAELEIPAGSAATRSPRLLLVSDLQGLASSLPAPFGKSAARSRDLQLELGFEPGRRTLKLRHADWLSGQLVLDAAGLPRGQLHFGRLNRDFTIRQASQSEPGLLITGELATFDFEAWRDVAARFAEDADADGPGMEAYLRLVDLGIGRLQVAGQELEDIDVEVQLRGEAWQIHGSNARLDGTLQVPRESGLPWNVALEYLRFPPRPEPDPEAGEPPEEVDLLEDVDPRALPAFAFSTRELSVGPSNLGSWSFDFEPSPEGAVISNLRMQEAASRIHGATADAGAGLVWRYRNGMHESRFDGMFAAGDLAQVMPKWGHDANIVSRQASFASALSWPGSPLAFSLKKASGDIDLDIANGRFVDIESGSSRLLGAFNFDSLVRRLELDFSDLYQRGFAFDTIKGKLGFTAGLVRFTTPLVIDGPSSRITIEGEIDLPRETIAADMLVRIPLGENISMLAGLLGAWPIALSTYLASKIFAAQVEDFTTIVYRLDGPWSDPQAGFAPPDDAAQPAAP